VAEALATAELACGDFPHALVSATRGDFVYLDPPYPPLNGTSFFAHYTKDRFGSKDQVRLAATVRELDRRGCLVMLSNADTGAIRKLYEGFVMTSLPVRRYVTCKAKKHLVRELVITNYRTWAG